MEPRPVTLTLAFALLLTANSPLPSFSVSTASRVPIDPTHSPPSSSGSTDSVPPPPPPPAPPSPPPSRRAPPPPPHSRPPPSNAYHPAVPLRPPSTGPSDARDPAGRPRLGRPPGPCESDALGHCSPRPPQRRRSVQPPPSPTRGAAPAPRVRGLNLGKKVGLSFLAAILVLQLVFGGFLAYARWQIKKAGYERDVASSSHSASSSVN